MTQRRQFLALGFAALPSLSLLPGAARASRLNPFEGVSTVEVFCNSAMVIEPIANPPFRQTIHRMDALDLMTRQLNSRLPQGGEAQARQWVMQRQDQIKRAMSPVAAEVANATNLARYYRIDHLPAIVVNGRAVVYGVTDVAEAIERYQAHIQQQGRQP